MIDLIGKRVHWTKLKSKPDASMRETDGQGSLARLELGKSMSIYGDYGVRTSTVMAIDSLDDGVVVVTTANSTYELRFY